METINSTEKKWKVYLIHHSHTDIGYTERQEKIMRYHYDFIRQAIAILDEESSSKAGTFFWQCENYWQVENFYELASNEEIKKFEDYVRVGKIGLSGNYLNMTELVSAEVLEDSLRRMNAYGERIGQKITSGMCADINGMAWGYSELLYRNGVENLFSCLHPHHGMFPLYKKVQPFFWKTPEGNKLLVWNGDHYHLGNELFLPPNGGTTYMIHDEFSEPIRNNLILNQSPENTAETEMKICTTRIERYLRNLEQEGYNYDFVPLMVSGAITDNSPPGKELPQRIQELNEYYKGSITFQMATLDTFFTEVRKYSAQIPCYAGDFTDWWADGIGSTPAEVKLYREAVRKYRLCKKLTANAEPEQQSARKGGCDPMTEAAKALMLYAEHTWGYSSSVSEPWESLVSTLELKKAGYAIAAHNHISRRLDGLLAIRGEVSIRQGRPQIYQIVNPHNTAVQTKAVLYIEFWEYLNGCRYDAGLPIVVTDCTTGERLPSQVKRISRAVQVEVSVFLQPKEERKVRIQLSERKFETTKNHAHIGAEGVEDLLAVSGRRADLNQIETDHFIIRMNGTSGIYSIWDKTADKELMCYDGDRKPTVKRGAFTGIYECTKIRDNACETRRKMGRGRRGGETKQYEAVLTGRTITENGDLYVAAELDYELEGTKMYTVFLKAYHHLPVLEAMVRIHKESRWEPENLYVALPFTAGEEAVAWLDKTGCIIRPGIDQLPGSCQDFYLIQNSVVWKSGERDIMLVTKDAPLITIGELMPGPTVLCNGKDWERNKAPVFSWVMNNYWETNFKVNLGGFYEFAYLLTTSEPKPVKENFSQCEALNEGVLAFYTEEA